MPRRKKEEGRRRKKEEQGIGVNLGSNVVPSYCLTESIQDTSPRIHSESRLRTQK
ncbi:hypothetical protein QUA83_11635 [Microcoleus sp. K1-B1]|uniref:hypothetical protein n=1 Tax=Microcoleus sp. K1-B6 TaxID=2818787 RepID=UPI002FD831FA